MNRETKIALTGWILNCILISGVYVEAGPWTAISLFCVFVAISILSSKIQ